MIRTFFKQITVNIILIFSVVIFAQQYPALDSSFDIGTGFSGAAAPMVSTIALQPDGKIIVGGTFSSYNGTTQNGIVRLHIDGSLDTSFDIGTGFSFWQVFTVALQPDGKIIVGGGFTSYNGTNLNRIVRLNADGSLDTSFIIGAGFINNNYDDNDGGDISTIVVQPDGKILVGGNFTHYNGQPKNSIARLNSNGSLDTSFNVEIEGNYSTTVRAIIMQPDGKILVGGNFTQPQNYIARLNSDGSLDNSFNISGNNSAPWAIVLQPDGKILVGATFSYNGISQNLIARLNPNGGLDTSFYTGIITGGSVRTIAIQPDGKILFGGYFNSGILLPPNGNIKRLNTDGSLDNYFWSGFNGRVDTIVLQPDGKILVGGQFTSYNGIIRNRLVRLNSDSTATIENIQSADTKLYPNPAEDFINLSSNDTIRNIIITDTSGRIMLTENYNNEYIKVDISHLPKAVYLLTITTDQGKETIKIVKK